MRLASKVRAVTLVEARAAISVAAVVVILAEVEAVTSAEARVVTLAEVEAATSVAAAAAISNVLDSRGDRLDGPFIQHRSPLTSHPPPSPPPPSHFLKPPPTPS